MKREELVEKFQCPGCVCGSNTRCGKYELSTYGPACKNHVPGTVSWPGGTIYLGLPTGFNKVGMLGTTDFDEKSRNNTIRLWEAGTGPEFDRLNVPVWAMEQDGFLFIRTYAPRINASYIDVVEGGTFESLDLDLRLTYDVRSFVDSID